MTVIDQPRRPAADASSPPSIPDAGSPGRSGALRFASVAAAVVIASVTSLNITASSLIRQLGVSTTQLQWIIASYSVALAGLLLVAGVTVDQVGARRVLRIGLGGFALASMAGALMTGPTGLIVCRSFAGGFAALVIPSSLAIAMATGDRASRADRARVIGVWSAGAGAGAAAGVLVAGALLVVVNWRGVFVASGIAAAIMTAAAPRFVRADATQLRRHLEVDLVGAALSLAALGLLVGGIIEISSLGATNRLTVTLLLASVVAFTALWSVERRQRAPLFDTALLRSQPFVIGAVAIAVQFMSMYGMQYLTLQYLQLVQGHPAWLSGLMNLPFPIGLMLVSPRSHSLVRRFGAQRLLPGGLGLIALGAFVLSRVTIDSPYIGVAAGLFLFGIGLAAATAPATAGILAALPPSRMGIAAALGDVFREVGGALGIAVFGSIAAAEYRSGLAERLQSLPAPARDAAGQSLGAAVGIAQRIGENGIWVALNARQSFMVGFRQAMETSAVLCAAVAVVLAVIALRRSDPTSSETSRRAMP